MSKIISNKLKIQELIMKKYEIYYTDWIKTYYCFILLFLRDYWIQFKVRNLEVVEMNMEKNNGKTILYNICYVWDVPKNISFTHLSKKISREVLDGITTSKKIVVCPELNYKPDCEHYIIIKNSTLYLYMTKSNHAKYKLRN